MNLRPHISLRLCHTIFLMCGLIGLSAIIGCSSDMEVWPASDDENPTSFHASFRLTINDKTNSDTRSAGHLGDEYDRGSGYENYIDIAGRDFRFLFFDANNLFVDSLTVTSVLPVETTATSKTYEVLGAVGEAIKNKSIKVIALANWGTYPDNLEAGKTTIDDLCAQTYSFSAAQTVPSEENTIPLYGVKALGTLAWDVNHYCHLGLIHLLRAYAKVEVSPAEGSLWNIKDVKLRRYNTRGFCAPAGVYTQNDYVHGNYADDYVALPHIPQNCESDSELPFVHRADGTFVIYLPEYRNIGRSIEERSRIYVQFEDNTSDYYPVDFKYYDNPPQGTEKSVPFDLLRNCWYRFTVKKNMSGVTVQLVPYAEVELTPDFGLDSPLQRLIPIYDEDRTKILYYYDTETDKYYVLEGEKLIETINPFWAVDAGTQWRIIRDDKGEVLYYYDAKNDIYYGPDKKTVIPNPYQ